MPFTIHQAEARTILSPVSGFLRDAGFTHSLTPSRNCTFGCSYCYVPTMRVQAGLRKEDWTHWGQWTTFKKNAAELLAKELRPDQMIYCSPVTDPYQPAEESAQLMRGLLREVAAHPPRRFVIQTRGPLILRDLDLLRDLPVAVSFSVTTDRDEVRRIFEPHCATIEQRFETVAALRAARVEVFVTLAPLLPSNPEALVARAVEATESAIIVDPFHVRAVKRSGATTRDAAFAIAAHHGFSEWLEPEFQRRILSRMAAEAKRLGRCIGFGSDGFGLLANPGRRPAGNLL